MPISLLQLIFLRAGGVRFAVVRWRTRGTVARMYANFIAAVIVVANDVGASCAKSINDSMLGQAFWLYSASFLVFGRR